MDMKYDLEERTYRFSDACKMYVRRLDHSLSNREYARQLIRSSGSVAANYIEANEAISKKDFFHRIKICRKEAKESALWLRLSDSAAIGEKEALRGEALELTKIFASILKKQAVK
ncbi:MAG: four helix bundle protein [Candidatus Magasanikbacteria bacterium CG10_big_fil_rev_8_21_14_0_10_47_10]|uniref:Four helix bundle protein n=1 Tax=Candidatus Magasanikbacteria bacterium CG10_big_fil_rev_8_21_14_0_10_47_10 TaxID=1974652 RepID=A0A2H0TPY6_9BACT|nr:MAG: four helix bundle protein [Candidatus Magasanikbacteria bacterium CG10_big_fil_rev_8_21_14_0_10_47_10]